MDEEFMKEIKQERKAYRKERIEEKVRARYRDTFMLAEDMEQELPLDLAESWLCVPVPSGGKRCLVIAAKGQTMSRLRNGAVLHRFSSVLPSGNMAKGSVNNPHHYCILDCVFHEPSLTYFVLDIQCWRGNLYYDCDTAFRYSFLWPLNVVSPSQFKPIPSEITGCIQNWERQRISVSFLDITSIGLCLYLNLHPLLTE